MLVREPQCTASCYFGIGDCLTLAQLDREAQISAPPSNLTGGLVVAPASLLAAMTGADSITVTRNEVLTTLNKPEAFILAIVAFQDDGGHEVRYVREPFKREPDFGTVSVNYRLRELWAREDRSG